LLFLIVRLMRDILFVPITRANASFLRHTFADEGVAE